MKERESNLPPYWLLNNIRVVLLGEIYPNIREVAIGYKEGGDITIRYYLDRKPTDFDYESIDLVAVELDAITPTDNFAKLDTECLFSDLPGNELDPLDFIAYARRERP